MNFKNLRKETNGITLIALVITIIVLLILAGISIATLTGENGVLTKANTAKENTQRAEIIERAKTDIFAIQAENRSGDITKKQFKEVLEKYFTEVPKEIPDELEELTLIAKEEYNGYKIKATEIWNGTFKEEHKIPVPTEECYVGYYADIEGDGTVDGVIYADLAKGRTGDGNWEDTANGGTHIIPIKTNTKEYYVSQANYEGNFGKKDVLTPMREDGEERFYIMTLEDFKVGDVQQFFWYYNAYGKLDQSETSEDFGTGKANTDTMIATWKDGSKYGKGVTIADGKKSIDIWGVIESEVNKGWFVPSRAEWSAFADELGISSENYESKFNLKEFYWSSSQCSTRNARITYFSSGVVSNNGVNSGAGFVRFSTTF